MSGTDNKEKWMDRINWLVEKTDPVLDVLLPLTWMVFLLIMGYDLLKLLEMLT